MNAIPKDPEAELDYAFNWANWLDTSTTPNESIIAHTVTVPSGLTLDSSTVANGVNTAGVTITNSQVVAWLSGGEVGEWYDVACKITTSAGRTDERTIHIHIEER